MSSYTDKTIYEALLMQQFMLLSANSRDLTVSLKPNMVPYLNPFFLKLADNTHNQKRPHLKSFNAFRVGATPDTVEAPNMLADTMFF